MRRIFKEKQHKPNSKHSPKDPKVLKTYSNKHKHKAQIVESFGLPDEPIISIDSSFPQEHNPIDLVIEPETNFNKTLIFGQWMPSDAVESSEINVDHDFRRKSFSAIDNVIFGRGNLETDVKGFNFEDDTLVQDASKSSNEENIEKKNKTPIVLVKSLNLNDISLLKINNLSPSKNKQEMLSDRWQRCSFRLKNDRKIQKSRLLRRISLTNSHSNNSAIELEGFANTLAMNVKDSNKDRLSPLIVEENNKTTDEKINISLPEKVDMKSSPNIDILSPRRITRRSAQQTADSLPNLSNESSSLSFDSLSGKQDNIVVNNSKLTICKKGTKSKPIMTFGAEPRNQVEVKKGLEDIAGNDGIESNPSENTTSPSNPRNLRSSSRFSNSMKLKNEMKPSPPDKQKSLQNNTSSSKKNRNTMQKALVNQTENINMLEEFNIASLFEASKHEDEVNVKELRQNSATHENISPSKNKKLDRSKNLDISRNTSTRKSNRLKLQNDEISTPLNQSVNNHSSSKNTPKMKNEVLEMELKSPPSKENEKIQHKETSQVQVKRPKGRPSKKKLSGIQDNSELSGTKDKEPIHKSNKDKRLSENKKSFSSDKIEKKLEDCTEISKINSVSKHQSSKEKNYNMNNSIIENENEIIINEMNRSKSELSVQNQNDIQIYDKMHEDSILGTDSEVSKKEDGTRNSLNQVQIKRKRGRPRKIVELKQHDANSEINICTDEKIQKPNGNDEGYNIENDSQVNVEKINGYDKEKTKYFDKQVGEDEVLYISPAVFHDDRSERKMEGDLPNVQMCASDEMVNIPLIKENKNSAERNDEHINGKKRKLCDELEILKIFQETQSEEKSEKCMPEPQKEMFYDEKLEDELKIHPKTSDFTLQKVLLSSKQEPYKENDQIRNHFNGETDKNVEKSGRTASGSPEIMNFFNIPQNDEDHITKTNETDNSKISVVYSDFGYDINRRTSFRKILERVMEISRTEMEMEKAERDKRCKSVPPEKFHRDIEHNNLVKSASADSKLKYLKDKKNSFMTMNNKDISRVKKCLDYKSNENKFSFRKTTESTNMIGPCFETVHQEEEKTKNGVLSIFNIGTNNCIDEDPKGEIKPEGFMIESHKSCNGISIGSSEKYKIEQEDLEVQNLLLGGISNNSSHDRIRSKSFSEGKSNKKFKHRPKSVYGKKFKKRTGTFSGVSGSTEAVKKVYEFNVGDSIWGKVGNYPYWPGLVTKDPETSDFKKYRLLRAVPYYHIRFFGDKAKRAWTSYCIPYEGPQDLDMRREQFSMEGHHNDHQVKEHHLAKWKRAVEEAETVKGYSLENKLKFFDEILTFKEKSDDISKNTEEIPVVHFKRARSKSFSCTSMQETNKFKSRKSSPQKEKSPMKMSSLLSCIENVVKNGTETPSELELHASSLRKKSSPLQDTTGPCNEVIKASSAKSSEKIHREIKSSPRKKNILMEDSSVLSCNDDVNKFCPPTEHKHDVSSRKRNTRESKKKMYDSDSDNDLALQLLEFPFEGVPIPSPKKKSTEPDSFCKSPEQSTSSETPVSSRRASVISPTRTRSRASLKHEKRRLSGDFKHDDDASVSSKDNIMPSSPRRSKLKRRTIEIGQSETEVEIGANSFLNNVMSRLPEHKKNLFRGVTKEKVCQICEKPGYVVKCKGPCNGDFHIECVENSAKLTEELMLKEQEALISKDNLNNTNSQLEEAMDDNKQVEITTVISRNKFSNSVVLSPINRKIPMMEQFDRKMKELMSKVESRISIDSTDSSSEEIDTSEKNQLEKKPSAGKNSKKRTGFKHVTAEDFATMGAKDDDTKQMVAPSEIVEQTSNADEGVYKCPYCVSTVTPLCFVCNSIVSRTGNTMRQRCSLQKCGRYYHLECLNIWHQTQWSFILHDKKKSEALDSFVCPRHSCHICASENLGVSMGRCPNDKLVKCLRCPATYHNSYHCVPAGTDILTSTQIVCPRHVAGNKKSNTINTIWCFVCSEGGNLICCETCPTSVHSECLPVNLLDDDTYICEDCESGRFPLYDEVVWVKCGTFRWWPAIILFPTEVPANVESKHHSKGEFVVKFFGTYDYFWVGRGRVFLYQEGDTGYLNNSKNKIDEAFSRAIKEAADVYNFKKGVRAKKQKEVNTGLKPPPYVRIKVNRPVGNVRVFEANLSNTTPCDCDPKEKSPCGPNSNCLNRILLTECDPEICPAGERCKNQAFEKREYAQVQPHRTAGRGWGLKSLEPIKKGQFVMEYVGEIIDDEEYQRRITRMHQQKDENYYFLTIDKDRMLDAGPKGNAARFMNHSCNPNCETQKWTVNGDTRVGLFAIENISTDTELTFNYNLECAGTEKKICRCGAPNCSGFIGVKPEDQRTSKKNSTVKPVEQEKSTDTIVNSTCFICGHPGDLGKCTHNSCLNCYHLECVQLKKWPKRNWKCSSHFCNDCSKSTARICVLCNNSYCTNHSEGKIRQDDSLGFLCSEHDQTRRSTRRKTTRNGNLDPSSSNSLNTSQQGSSLDKEKSETLRSERYRKRTSCFESSIPKKKLKLNDSIEVTKN